MVRSRGFWIITMMKLKTLAKSKQKLKLEVEGEGHTLLNLMVKTTQGDEKVDVAVYRKGHSHIDNPVLLVHTKDGGDPTKALKRAAKGIQDQAEEFSIEFQRAIGRGGGKEKSGAKRAAKKRK